MNPTNPEGTIRPAAGENAGRRRITEALAVLLDALDESGRPVAEIIAETWLNEARSGSVQHLKELLDRTEGRVGDRVEPDAVLVVHYTNDWRSPPTDTGLDGPA